MINWARPTKLSGRWPVRRGKCPIRLFGLIESCVSSFHSGISRLVHTRGLTSPCHGFSAAPLGQPYGYGTYQCLHHFSVFCLVNKLEPHSTHFHHGLSLMRQRQLSAGRNCTTRSDLTAGCRAPDQSHTQIECYALRS